MFEKGTKLLYTSPYKSKELHVKDEICIFDYEKQPGKCVVKFKKGTEYIMRRQVDVKFLRRVTE